MNKAEIKKSFIENLEKERVAKGWTQQEMADKLEMSIAGYRKMVAGNTETVALSVAFIASKLLDIPLPILCGSKDKKDKVAYDLYKAPDSICNRIDYYLTYSKKINETASKYVQSRRIIDVFTLQGYMTDGMTMNSRLVEKKIIPDRYGDRVVKGVRITENSFLPIYSKGDVILLDESSSRHGDICLVMHLPTQKVYLRKLIFSDVFELHPITNRGNIIYMPQKERHEWFDYGHVIGYLKEEELTDIDVEL